MSETATLLEVSVEGSDGFERELDRLRHRGESDLAAVEPAVRDVLAAPALRGVGEAALPGVPPREPARDRDLLTHRLARRGL